MRVGIALGSNQGDRVAHLHAACTWLQSVSQGPVLTSRIYETQPIDCSPGTPSFLNSVCEIGFEGDLHELLHQLREFERRQGRPLHYAKNAPRPLDLDLLYADNVGIQSEELTLPHPRMLERAFVLKPLCDVHPDLKLPGSTKSVKDLLASFGDCEGVKLYR